MAYEKVGTTHARNAGADLSAKLFYLLKVDTDGDLILCSAATDAILGNCIETAAENNPVTVQLDGIGRVIAGATITAGDRLTSDASGKAIKATVAASVVIGIALFSASANEIFPFAFSRGHVAVS